MSRRTRSTTSREVDEDLEPGRTTQDGVFVAGTAAGIRDIPDTIVHASAAASQVAAYLRPAEESPMSAERLGVFICHCGGNISDYVDVEKVRSATSRLPGCAVSKTFMFACSDAAQQEMMEKIRTEQLDGIVIASCSPKLHLETFRAMAQARRAEPAHVRPRQRPRAVLLGASARHAEGEREGRAPGAGRHCPRGARPTAREHPRRDRAGRSGHRRRRGGIARRDRPLRPRLVGASGGARGGSRRADPHAGQAVPVGPAGGELVASLRERLEGRDNVVVYTNAELVEKSGSAGRFEVKVRSGEDTFSLKVGAIVAATGFDPYAPQPGEYGHGLPAVVTLPEFNELLTSSRERPSRQRPRRAHHRLHLLRRQPAEPRATRIARGIAARRACTPPSRCTTSIRRSTSSTCTATCGPTERTSFFTRKPAHKGSVFVRYDESEPPEVERDGDGLLVRVRDELSGGDSIEIPADLVVLVTGMVASSNERLQSLLKLPVSAGGFFNEIHLKLRPVETVVDGVFIAGTAQAPKNLAESVASSLAAARTCSAMLLKGYLDRAPLVARVDAETCVWCEECMKVCPYDGNHREGRARRQGRSPKCGPSCARAAAPVPRSALRRRSNVDGYTNAQVTAMIDALAAEVTA